MAPRHAAISDYRTLQKRIGTTRAVIVTPRNYATDNRATVDAIAQLGQDGRGIAVLRPAVTNAELNMLHEAGVRGTHFSLGDPASAVVTPAWSNRWRNAWQKLGWHVQFNMSGDQIVALLDVLERLPCR